MGLGQTLLTIMALMLMGRLILTANRTTLESGFTKDMAEYRITATSLGTSLLENTNSLAFDEATVDTFLLATQKSSLTAPTSLGPDVSETNVNLYDDIDDYNNYSKIDTLPNSAIFKTLCKVEYLSVSGDTLKTVNARSWNKLVTVFVTSDYLVDYSKTPPQRDTLKFQTVFSYWYFR